MAVVPMKKVTIIGHRHDQAKLVGVLQDAGAIEIVKFSEEATDAEAGGSSLSRFRAEQIRHELSKVRFVRDFLARAAPPKTGVLSGLLPDRLVLSRPEFAEIGTKIDFETIHEQARAIDSALSQTEAEIEALLNDRETLAPWAKMELPFSELVSTERVGTVLAGGTEVDIAKLLDALREVSPAADVTVVDSDTDGLNIVVIFPARHGRSVRPLLVEAGLEIFQPEWPGRPVDEIRQIDLRVAAKRDKQIELKAETGSLARYTRDLKVLEDWLRGQLSRAEIQARFEGTQTAFALAGWVEAAKTAQLVDRLQTESRIVDYAIEDPQSDEKVPTVLHNPRWARPFEVLTKLYGVPNYRELDPTPLMGLFFFLFFGIALGDAGYGLVLAVFCLWLKGRLVLTPAGRQWLDLFALGGLSSILIGISTGSYFGFPKERLPEFMQALIVLDPLSEALLFLLITLALGATHVVLGMALEVWDSWIRGRYAQAFYRDLPRLAVAVAATVLATGWIISVVLQNDSQIWQSLTAIGLRALGWTALLYILSSGEFLRTVAVYFRHLVTGPRRERRQRIDEAMALLLLTVMALSLATTFSGRWAVFIGAAAVGIAASAAYRQALAGLGAGLYNLYGMTRFLNDVLSYSRLMALGLATYLIGFVINILAGLVAGATLLGLPVGLLLAPAIALPLHVANLSINLLSAFVHPLRLQFVEFFSQFYEGGGEVFTPFAFETENLIFREE